MWHACSGHATRTWCCVEFSTPVCAYVTRKVLIHGSGIGFGQIYVRSQNPGICQNLDFSLKVEILARSSILAPNMDPSQNPGPSQNLARTDILARSWFGPDSGCPSSDPGPTQDLVRTDILARSWIGPGSMVGPGQSADPGPIYRPLSITTSVENDWGRWGPFWQVRLTLALETARF